MNKEDKTVWGVVRTEIKHTITRDNFKTICSLHAKYFKHSYYEPCTCNKKTIKNWIASIEELYTKTDVN